MPNPANPYKMWHNPRCSKSRQTLQLLRDRGIEPEVYDYLKRPPEIQQISEVLELLGLEAKDLLRKGDSVYAELDLGKVKDPQTLLRAMHENPILIERPILIHDGKAVIGRPPEKVLTLI